ncbi:unnamed protein product [Brachionus calyciflorus]|uniref:2Fe-2S ferredoxin-type domain-containing protein n=1 Tax=Brachionus calyciflorus TaxID=104777 RepID=A0A813MKP8_9BILA|nr:unnamed protein product [Brachionus calyciflorus]
MSCKTEKIETNEISFYVNGKLQKIKDEYPLYTSLGSYIRNVLKLTGTKVYCHEGGCGCCVVHATEFDSTTNQYKELSVNSVIFT